MLEGKTSFWIVFLKDEGNQGKYRRWRRNEVYFRHSVTFSFSSRFMWSCDICVYWFIFMLTSVNRLTKNRTNIFITGLERKGLSGVYSDEFKDISQRFYTCSNQTLCLYEPAQHHSTQCKLMPVYVADDLALVYNTWFVSHSPNSWVTNRGKVFIRFWV